MKEHQRNLERSTKKKLENRKEKMIKMRGPIQEVQYSSKNILGEQRTWQKRNKK